MVDVSTAYFIYEVTVCQN